MGNAEVLHPLTFNGRAFSPHELELIRQICLDFASLGRTEISRTVCELLEAKRRRCGTSEVEIPGVSATDGVFYLAFTPTLRSLSRPPWRAQESDVESSKTNAKAVSSTGGKAAEGVRGACIMPQVK